MNNLDVPQPADPGKADSICRFSHLTGAVAAGYGDLGTGLFELVCDEADL